MIWAENFRKGSVRTISLISAKYRYMHPAGTYDMNGMTTLNTFATVNSIE
jgi:hypothetical protein